MTTRKTALITGATAGIGAAFSRRLAIEGYDLVVVARDERRLAATAAELADRHGTRVSALPADLSTEEGIGSVAVRLADAAAPVDLLVNNAGSSLNTSFLKAAPEDESRLLRLNVLAVLRLTRAALPAMVDRRAGDIINVSSVSGFAAVMPGSTYPASKAWVTSFSESVALSVRRHGVRVMALCPGYTRTEFHQRQGIDTSRMPGWLWLDADDVARDGLRDLRRDRIVSVPDWKYKAAVAALRLLPRPVLYRVAPDNRGRTDGGRNGGRRNSGDRNSDDRNSGDRNSGDRDDGRRATGDRTPEVRTAGTGTNEISTNEISSTEIRTPDTSTSKTGTPRTGKPGSGAPDAGTHETRVPETRTPDSQTPDARTLDSRTTEGGTPDCTAPDGTAPDGGTPDSSNAGSTMRDDRNPDDRGPDGPTPGGRTADAPATSTGG